MFGNKQCQDQQCTEPVAPTLVLENSIGTQVHGMAIFVKYQSLFQYTYIVTMAGQYRISVIVQGKAVKFKPQPYVQVLPADTDAGSFLVNWWQKYAAGPISLFLQARDRFLNNISTGGDSIQVKTCIAVHPKIGPNQVIIIVCFHRF